MEAALKKSFGEEMYFVSSEPEVMTVVMAAFVLAKDIGFSAVEVSEISTSVSELATNIVKYAQIGSVFFHVIETAIRKGIEIRAEDQGQGINDIQRAMRDCESTSGTLGLGLPGVKRMMDEFHIQSSPTGTQVVVRKWVK
ncbi:anti-sigma regulatory factor [Vibrio sp. S9_S30]|uniref:anti-sigma regulatory factor n=1 Tax=Vibrio sp. S9_S30 TaxID=2720226 RepID=UPI00168012D1|nr:anti-sigma regulatory factor [Vibrio sp. S9_S30]MBD1556770.1 anti-sigma regulatory factor [Vibrio sp. S9_S30]